MLRRKISETLKIWNAEAKNECLVVKGARQVGKTYILKKFLEENFEHSFYVDFNENPKIEEAFNGNLDVDTIIKNLRPYLGNDKLVPGKTAIFFDEIQFCPRARAALKSFAVDGRYRIIASGSLLGLNYKDVRSYPVGYERVIELRSMDFEEFLWAIGIDEEVVTNLRECIGEKKELPPVVLEALDEYFRLYMVIGGMPEAVSRYVETKDIAEAAAVHRKIVEGYRNDVGKYAPPSSRDKIFACFDSVPVQLGEDNKKFMYSRIDGGFLPSYTTYASSINWLSDAGVISRCFKLDDPHPPLEMHASSTAFKIYMQDTGLMISMLGQDAVHAVLSGDKRYNKGSLTENVVAECISKCGHRLYYFSTKSFEIDFITVMRGAPVAIEVKSGNNRRSKSLDSMKEKYKVGRRMKFETTNIHVTDDGVEHYPLFACAFIESMFEPYDLTPKTVDVDEINRIMGSGKNRGE